MAPFLPEAFSPEDRGASAAARSQRWTYVLLVVVIGLGSIDGARMWNAAVTLGISGAELTGAFDTVSMCLSKGLGAPAGSVLSGPADLIRDARRWRKMLGGGLRQAGVLAAAGLHALDHHVERLNDDHRRARQLADGLGEIDGISVRACNTNMVFLTIAGAPPDLGARLHDRGVHTLVSNRADNGQDLQDSRLVTHLEIDDEAVAGTIEAFAAELH